MKLSKLLIIFCILNYCLTATSDECSSAFEEALKKTCVELNSNCRFADLSKICFGLNSCEDGNNDNLVCQSIIPDSYNLEKCEYNFTDGKCNPTKKNCGDYNPSYGDTCSHLSSGVEGKRCALSKRDLDTCEIHKNNCSDLSQTECADNIPSTVTEQCEWKSIDSVQSCQQVNRTCTNYLKEFATGNDYCNELITSDANKKCVHLDDSDICTESHISCQNYSNQYDCDGKYPLKKTGNIYENDYTQICQFNTTTNKCVPVSRKCREYNPFYGDDKSTCINILKPEDPNKNCIYDEDDDDCYERYTSCQAYNDNEINKVRGDCEKIKPSDETKRCVFIMEEDKCIEENIYADCKDYKGSDKKICESIISPKTNSYCVLEKDLTCTERTFHCSEAENIFDCLIYAKPSDNSKKCAFGSNGCYETYKGCEDWELKDSTTCASLGIFNGQECYLDSDKCKSRQKKCTQALNEEECKMIETSGVTDPDKKYCYYGYDYNMSTTHCYENYKYCSDYRGNKPNICKNIQPYDESGKNLDYAYKCEIKDTNVGCEKVPKECSEASNKIQCDYISPVINDKRIKYCLYHNGQCNEEYKTCEDVNEEEIDTNFNSKCSNNLPTDYLKTKCETKTENGKTKCVSKTMCDTFNSRQYDLLCMNINLNCTYRTSTKTCSKRAKTCNQINFYDDNNDNESICKSTKTSDNNKICILRDDKSGCKEVWKEEFTITKANAVDSSEKTIQNIRLILFLISLLF